MPSGTRARSVRPGSVKFRGSSAAGVAIQDGADFNRAQFDRHSRIGPGLFDRSSRPGLTGSAAGFRQQRIGRPSLPACLTVLRPLCDGCFTVV